MAKSARRDYLSGVPQEALRALSLWGEAGISGRRLEAALAALDARSSGPFAVSLGTLSEWLVLFESKSGVIFDGVEGIALPVSWFGEPLPDPGSPEELARVLHKRFRLDPTRESRDGLFPVVAEPIPFNSHTMYADAAQGQAVEDGRLWWNERRGWLRAPGHKSPAPSPDSPPSKRSASSHWAFRETVKEQLWAAMATEQTQAVERQTRRLDRVNARIEKLLALAPEPVGRGLPQLDLYEADRTPFLILPLPTGVKLGGQVGGMSCLNPRIHGVGIPLEEEPWQTALGDFFHRHGSCGVGDSTAALENELLAAWPTQPGTRRIEFDRARAKEGTEAWFPVVVRATRTDSWAWMNARRGFLLMPDNCD